MNINILSYVKVTRQHKGSLNEGRLNGTDSTLQISLLVCGAGEEPVLHGESPGKAEAAAEQGTRADVQLARDTRQSGTLCW